MDDVISLINYLINTKYSIDKIDLISEQVQIPNEQIRKILRAERYNDYFQLLKHKNQGVAKIALTLDLFCCTHYAQQCKNQSCPFLHLCPYNIRPMHGKCTNKICPYDHEVLKSAHNKKIINTRGLSFLSDNLLLEIARASANPNRSFWVCTDHGKKTGCSKKNQCEKLHYCYYSLTNACTKPHCPHVINEACVAYFRRKELAEQEHDDILETFRKVLRQRKPDYINTIFLPPHPTWALRAVTNDNANTSTVECNAPFYSNLSPTAPEYNGMISFESNCSTPSAAHEQDIFLIDCYDEHDFIEVERSLTEQIGFPIKLLISKKISSQYKNSQDFNQSNEPIYYYCPIENLSNILDLIRCQNEEKQLSKPLIVYSNAGAAHEATDLNVEYNQFCLLRLLINQSNFQHKISLEINDPSKINFDRMWIYVYDN